MSRVVEAVIVANGLVNTAIGAYAIRQRRFTVQEALHRQRKREAKKEAKSCQ